MVEMAISKPAPNGSVSKRHSTASVFRRTATRFCNVVYKIFTCDKADRSSRGEFILIFFFFLPMNEWMRGITSSNKHM